MNTPTKAFALPRPPIAEGEAVAPGSRPIRSVVNELLWVILPVVLLVQIAATVMIAASHFRTIDDRLAEVVQNIASSRARLAGEPLWKMNHDRLLEIADEILRIRKIVSAEIHDDTGALVASARAPVLGDREVTVPIRYRNGLIDVHAGRLRLVYTRSELWGQLRQEILIPATLVILASLASLMALRIAAHIYIGRPLRILTDTIVRSRREGRHYRATTTAQNELGELARCFNDLQEANAAAVARLAMLASQDALTGLPNRRGLGEQFKRVCENGGNIHRNVAVHFIDLDDFKAINDTFGHETGDRFLIHVAEQLKRVIGPDDLIARLGGDEFIVVQQDAPDEGTARDLARRMLEALSTPFAIHDKKISARAGIGIALSDTTVEDLDRLPALADIALYHAKTSGPGTISVLSHALQLAYSRTREIELALPAAFAEQQFEVWFQAQFDMRTGAVCGLEALSRWFHPEHGYISPGEFLPLIEKTSNSGRLAAVVLEEACAAAAYMRSVGREDIRVAVNLSPAELVDRSIVDTIFALTERHGVPPSALEVEITEGTLIKSVANTSSVIQSLREMGVSIALDDFGTGYSSLAYLRRFPIDKIKIDKAFVRNLPDDRGDLAVVEIIALLASRLGLKVVAEGIEREEQAHTVKALGLHIGQGFRLHRPRPFADVKRLLREQAESLEQDLRAAG